MPYVAVRDSSVTILHPVYDEGGSITTASVTSFSVAVRDPSGNSQSSAATWSQPTTSGYLNVILTPDEVGNWIVRVTNPTTNSDGTTYDYYVQCLASTVGLTPSGTWLTTLTNLKQQLGISLADTTHDAFLTNLIARGTEMIESTLGRNVVSASYTEDYDGGGQWLRLRQGPIISVTSVCDVQWNTDGTATTSALEAGTYRAYNTADEGSKLAGRIKADSWSFVAGNKTYRVAYTAGWSTVPYEIEALCLDVCVWLWNTRKDAGNTSRDAGSGAMSFRSWGELDEMIRTRLASYMDYA